MIPTRLMRGLALVAVTIFVGCGASIPKPAPPASAGASRSPGDAAAFPRGYDAISYSLELSLLDPDGLIDGLLVVEVVARRSALTEVASRCGRPGDSGGHRARGADDPR